MIEKLIPKFIREGYEEEVLLAGFEDPSSFFKNLSTICLMISLILSPILVYYFRIHLLLLPLIILLIFYILSLSLINVVFIMSDMRAREAEERLPDMLFLIASNLRSGMPIDRALWYSAKEELGVVGRELKRVSIEISTGIPFTKALRALGRRFKSDVLRRVIDIIIQGILSGGNLAPLLERVAIDIREQKSLEKEASTSVGMYVWFIIIASVFLAPILFSSSVSLIELMIKIGGPEGVPIKAVGPIGITGFRAQFSPKDLYIFAFLTVFLINTFSAFLIGEIKYGNLWYGIRYVPFFLIISLLSLHISHKFLLKIFFEMLG